jgi:hypothetical protein
MGGRSSSFGAASDTIEVIRMLVVVCWLLLLVVVVGCCGLLGACCWLGFGFVNGN